MDRGAVRVVMALAVAMTGPVAMAPVVAASRAILIWAGRRRRFRSMWCVENIAAIPAVIHGEKRARMMAAGPPSLVNR